MRTPTDADLEALAYVKASESRNDPNYDKEIERQAKDVATLDRTVTSVQVIDGYDPHVKVRAGSDIKRVKQAAAAIGRLADVPVADATGYRAPNGHHQPLRHTFYKDDQK